MSLATSTRKAGQQATPPGVPPSRPPGRIRLMRQVGPWLMLAPVIAVLAVLVGYPLYRLFVVSFQEYGRAQVFGQPAPFVGLDNYRAILTDQAFWKVFERSVLFCLANVVITMVIGTLVAILLTRLNRFFKLLTSIGLLVAWAMPALTAIIIWGWMFDTQFGVVNYLLTKLTPWEFTGHSWLINPMSFFLVATVVIVWQSVPFVAFSVYAGLTQVPDDVLEAAELDGANGRQRFRHVTFAYLRPIFLILTVLQVIWDLRVFTQIYALQSIGGIREKTSTLGVYIYQTSIGSGDFGEGGAMAVILVIVMLAIAFWYVYSSIKAEES
jgi:N,N'-diacetylchitobiose transport system permease protein